MKFYYFCIILFLSSCSDRSRDNVIQQHSKDTFANDIIGDWGGENEETPVFKFKNDSVYYFQRHRSYPYTLQDSTLIFHFQGDTDLAPIAAFKIIKIDADSMLWLDYSLRNPDNTFFRIKAYRFKGSKKSPTLSQ